MRGVPDLRRAAAMAARVLVARRADTLPIDPLSILRACRDTRVYTFDAAMDVLDLPPQQLEAHFAGAEAATFRIPGEHSLHYIVVYRLDGHPARLRFTLAHELGHRLLGHTGSTPSEEVEADCFASYLLCPEPVLRVLRGDGKRQAAERIATSCYVSLACARMALRRRKIPMEPVLEAALEDMFSPMIESLHTAVPKAE